MNTKLLNETKNYWYLSKRVADRASTPEGLETSINFNLGRTSDPRIQQRLLELRAKNRTRMSQDGTNTGTWTV